MAHGAAGAKNYLQEWDAERKVFRDGDGEKVAGVEAWRIVVDVADDNDDAQRGGPRWIAPIERQQMAAVSLNRLTRQRKKEHTTHGLYLNCSHN